ncbi:MAG: hypothetical protein HLUCCX14_07725 [Marinobacter excellens HL-55]|uniref:Uncharacterized protein n=1 Tax=Marinobacter excellens HL-55 TaxID=1305731 RepID=A0A0P8BL58_9GAMM|nr:MAG: hypothetical protein HLUCCX14_07725 [Marinobacter excellens HL-55]
MSKNELIHPSEPINGRTLSNLKAVLESYLGGGEIRDLDLALLMNVPLNRLSQLKRAKSSVYTVGRAAEQSVLQQDTTGDDDVELPGIRPSQAVLVRLLLKCPQLVPIPLRPTSVEVFELLQPFINAIGEGQSVRPGAKSGFAPLFGRSYISSYKMLSEGAAGIQSAGLPVARLQLLVVGKYAELFKAELQGIVSVSDDAPDYVINALKRHDGWALLREKDSLTDWLDDEAHLSFESAVHKTFGKWFNDCYLAVLRDEAKSRDLDPFNALVRGKWVNNSPVSDDKFLSYDRFCRPILGRSDSLFALFRESFGLTSAEAYWVLGLQVKAFYRFRQRPQQRVDAPTAILLRYLFRYPEDIRFLISEPMAGHAVLAYLKQEDKKFKLGQLAPLFGASRVMSYEFANPETPCPFFARRLSMIFRVGIQAGIPIYSLLKESVEEEIEARGIDPGQFAKDGRWHK